MTPELDEARASEATLRSQLAEAVADGARAGREAQRLRARSELSGADPAVAAAAEVQAQLATQAKSSVEGLRAQLRRVEGFVAALEARADAERAAGREAREG